MWAQSLVETGALDSASAGLARFEDWMLDAVRSGRIVWFVLAVIVVFVAYRLLRNL